ncbi:MAG: TRAM domain-containing protein [Nitrospirota bacterium]|nr:MAG: TRAM domain-containing protein [Nitrospirota bacterium]
MNRRYNVDEYLSKIDMLRKHVPEIAITTDIIAGFPGETDEDHKATVKALTEIRFDGIFAFNYSPRPMTRAAEMDGQIEPEIRSERLAEILELQDRITLEKNRKLEGSVMEVLVDDFLDRGMPSSRTRTNKIVRLKGNNVIKGSIVNVQIEKAHKHNLLGRLDK